MKTIDSYIIERLQINKDTEDKMTDLDREMEVWDQRMKGDFGAALKELQCIIIDLGLYNTHKNEYGLNVYTPFDNYITGYALDGDKEYTYKHIYDICRNYDYVYNHKEIEKQLKKLEKLSKKK